MGAAQRQVRAMLYEPRQTQLALHAQLKRFNVLVCHRRFGKTVLAVNQLIGSALKCTKNAPRFAYIAPLRNQAKTVAWDYLLHYSAPFRASANIAELSVNLINGARITLYGADNPDALRGIYLDGVVLDEYAQMAPKTWSEVLRPAIADRGGFAIFIGTPKGRNNFFQLYEAGLDDPEWFVTMLKASDTGVVDPDELRRLKSAMSEDEYAQEFECSFQAANAGAYYGKQMTEAAPRITRVPWEPKVPVTTAWDLGIDDATSIWFCQQVGKEVRLIDYYENSGEGLPHYAAQLKARPYVYGDHLLPHDAQVKELGTGMSRVEVLQGYGINPTVVPMQRVEDGINAVRMLLPRCYWDAEKCAQGVLALQEYSRDWVDKLETWRASPRHDKWSHGADAFRYLAIGLQPPNDGTEPQRNHYRGEGSWMR